MPTSIFNFPCSTLFRKKPTKTHDKAFGIEIEAEPKIPGDIIFDNGFIREWWDVKADGSLRNGGLEFVSTIVTPDVAGLVFEEMVKLIKWNLLSSTSPRTSVHIHLNFNTRPFLEVISFYALYVLLEDIITKYCGHSREGNIFAIESSKGMYLHNKLLRMISTQEVRSIDNNYRYSNINLASLGRFGTIEMRSMRGLTEHEDVINWVDILNGMRFSIRGKTPKNIDAQFQKAPEALVPKLLLDWCVKTKFDWLGSMNSQYSLFYDLIGSHPTEWDMNNPLCDFRNEPGLLAFSGYSEREAFQVNRDTWKNFTRNRPVANAPFNGVILNQPDFVPENPPPIPRREGRADRVRAIPAPQGWEMAMFNQDQVQAAFDAINRRVVPMPAQPQRIWADEAPPMPDEDIEQ